MSDNLGIGVKDNFEDEDPLIPEEKLDFWIKNNLNVLLTGKHGVGKTSIIAEMVKKNNLRGLYFSCGTLDPYIDLIGIPTKTIDAETGIEYMDLARPKAFALDEADFIMLDEANRASPKVQNALMELIQFGSINGMKFKSLRCVWAGINPQAKTKKDVKYHVEDMDPAQKDRFHIHYTVPYIPSKKYFTQKFGLEKAKGVINWWTGLDEEIKNLVSPRRLDYAMSIMQLGGDVADVLPDVVSKSEFLDAINYFENTRKALQEDLKINYRNQLLHQSKASIETLYSVDPEMLRGLINALTNEEAVTLVNMHFINPANGSFIRENKKFLEMFTLAQLHAVENLFNSLVNLNVTVKSRQQDMLREIIEANRISRAANAPTAGTF